MEIYIILLYKIGKMGLKKKIENSVNAHECRNINNRGENLVKIEPNFIIELIKFFFDKQAELKNENQTN